MITSDELVFPNWFLSDFLLQTMNAENVGTLNVHRFQFVREMHPDDLIDFLLSSGVFNAHHASEIKVVLLT
jgi:hypothetical protein